MWTSLIGGISRLLAGPEEDNSGENSGEIAAPPAGALQQGRDEAAAEAPMPQPERAPHQHSHGEQQRAQRRTARRKRMRNKGAPYPPDVMRAGTHPYALEATPRSKLQFTICQNPSRCVAMLQLHHPGRTKKSLAFKVTFSCDETNEYLVSPAPYGMIAPGSSATVKIVALNKDMSWCLSWPALDALNDLFFVRSVAVSDEVATRCQSELRGLGISGGHPKEAWVRMWDSAMDESNERRAVKLLRVRHVGRGEDDAAGDREGGEDAPLGNVAGDPPAGGEEGEEDVLPDRADLDGLGAQERGAGDATATQIDVLKIVTEKHDRYKKQVKGKWAKLSQEEKDALDIETNPAPTDKFMRDILWEAMKARGIRFFMLKKVGGVRASGRYAIEGEVTRFWRKKRLRNKNVTTSGDSGSIRQYLFSVLHTIDRRKNVTARREFAARQKRKIEVAAMEDIDEAPSFFQEAGTEKLGGNVAYVPQYEKPKGASTDETEDTYKEVMKEVEAEAKRQRTAAGESEEKATSPNLHKTMFCMLVQCAALFQFLLAIEAAKGPCAFAVLIAVIHHYTEFAIEELAELHGYSDYAERWANDWKAMLLEITFSLLRKLCVQCNKCHRMPGDDRSTLFGWHLDHLLKFWKKKEGVSQMKSVRAMIKEALKTCLVCAHCHEYGHPNPEYPERLGYKSRLQYFCGDQHRTVRAILAFKEVMALILDLRMRGAFGYTQELPCSWQTLVVVVWMHLGIFLEDLIYFREDDWKNGRTHHRYRIALAIVREVVKKLSVRCPNPVCPERFANMIPACTSGIHLNHQLADGEKTDGPAAAYANKGVDAYLFELMRGNCDGTCACCHGIITALQEGTRSMTDALSWAKPSLRRPSR